MSAEPVTGDPGAAPRTERQQLGDQSRRRILDAAGQLMAERGYAGTSISAVSARSGLPASSIYWHFRSKEGLLAAVIEDGALQWFAGLPNPAELDAPPTERLAQMLVHVGEALEDRPEFLRLLLLISLERPDESAASLETVRRVRGYARAGLRAAIEAELAARRIPADDATLDTLARFSLAVADAVFIAAEIEPGDTDIPALFRVLAATLPAAAEAATRRRA